MPYTLRSLMFPTSRAEMTDVGVDGYYCFARFRCASLALVGTYEVN